MFARCMAWISSSIAAGWFLEVPGTELLLILALCLLPFSATCRSELPGTESPVFLALCLPRGSVFDMAGCYTYTERMNQCHQGSGFNNKGLEW